MKYLLLLCSDVAGPEASGTAEMPGCGDWTEVMRRRGILHDAGGLQPATSATTIRVREGDVLLTDGPFAETKDQIGGYSVIECADLDEAIGIVAAHPWAGYGMIEIRPMRNG